MFYVPLCVMIEGWFVLGSSALTGNIWDGKLHVFSDYEDYLQCPNLTMIACNTPSGINDALWYGMYICIFTLLRRTHKKIHDSGVTFI